jgi:hypothetical protein
MGRREVAFNSTRMSEKTNSEPPGPDSPLPPAAIVRTVVDLTSRSLKHVSLLLLLVASWHRQHANSTRYPLEVVAIGPVPRSLSSFLAETGTILTPARASSVARRCPLMNKTLGCPVVSELAPVLLIDNDVCFLRPIDGVPIGSAAVMATEPGAMRVDPQQWQWMQENLDVQPLLRSYLPITDYPPGITAAEFRSQALTRRLPLYVNSGVLLISPGCSIRRIWEHSYAVLAEKLGHMKSSLDSLLACDQPSLSLAIATLGSFEWLPISYNYRPVCFLRGLCDHKEISIVHMVGHLDGKKNSPGDSSVELSTYLQIYWEQRVAIPLLGLRTELETAEYSRRLVNIQHVLKKMQEICKAYQLNHIIRGIFEELPTLTS